MHICFTPIDFHTREGGGGIASYVRVMAEALLRRGHRVTVVAVGRRPETGEGGDPRRDFRVVWAPIPGVHWYLSKLLPENNPAVLPLRELEWSVAVYRALLKISREDPIDVVEGVEGGNSWVHWGKKWPLVVRLHGERYVFAKYSGRPLHSGIRLLRRLELSYLRKADRVTSPSRFQANEMAGAMKWPADRIEVIPNPVSPWFLARAEKAGDKRASEEAVVLYTGRIEFSKGTIPLLESVPAVAKAVPRVRFVIAGGRHPSIDDRTLERLLAENGRGRHVEILGHVPWKSLVDWYRAASLFVMPSYMETFGISCLEAMAFGLPVVASNTSALPEVVEDGVTGLLVPPGDPDALARAVIRLLGDPDLRRRLGEAGRKRVMERFGVERIVTSMLAVYRSVAE